MKENNAYRYFIGAILHLLAVEFTSTVSREPICRIYVITDLCSCAITDSTYMYRVCVTLFPKLELLSVRLNGKCVDSVEYRLIVQGLFNTTIYVDYWGESYRLKPVLCVFAHLPIADSWTAVFFITFAGVGEHLLHPQIPARRTGVRLWGQRVQDGARARSTLGKHRRCPHQREGQVSTGVLPRCKSYRMQTFCCVSQSWFSIAFHVNCIEPLRFLS